MLITFDERIRRCLRSGFCLPDASPGRVTNSRMARSIRDGRSYRKGKSILDSDFNSSTGSSKLEINTRNSSLKSKRRDLRCDTGGDIGFK